MSAKFTHNGVEIELRESDGEFFARFEHGGRKHHLGKPSLAAMKKAIDDVKKVKFEPIEAYASIWGNEYEKVRIVAVEKQKLRSGRRSVFISDKGDVFTKIYPTSKEFEQINSAAKKYRAESRKLLDQRRKRQGELEDALAAFAIKPENYKAMK